MIAAVLLPAAAAPAAAQSAVPDRYDDAFRKYAKRFFGVGFDWRLFKAQAMVESNIDPHAKSRVGARGIMQLMPATYHEVRSKNPDLHVLNDVERNIAAGIAYGRRLWTLWTNDSHEPDWSRFMLGSYNAGRSTVLRAQRIALDRGLDGRAWPTIETVAPVVPRWQWRETINYVERVRSNLRRMDAVGRVR